MIAYFIKLATLLFGDTLFALTMVGFVTIALTSWIIYLSARLFLSKEASLVAMSLWLFAPMTTYDLVKATTYNTPLTLFWALTLYFVLKYIDANKTKYLYAIGASLGLALLSKYSAVVLILALLIFLISSKYRVLFKNQHFYTIILLALALFSPVILWNYHHDWLSFLYQLDTHQIPSSENPFLNIFKAIYNAFLPALNFMLIPFFVSFFKSAKSENEKIATMVKLCQIVCATVIGFYLVNACSAKISSNWLAQYLISSALLGGYCYEYLNYRKSNFLLLSVFAVVSFGLAINNSYKTNFVHRSNTPYFELIRQVNKNYPDLPKTVFTSGWSEARMLYFLKSKPTIYTLDCNSFQNQYGIWSSEITKAVAKKSLKEVIFLDQNERLSCLKKYFDYCERLPTKPYYYKKREYSIYLYSCKNKA